jgi:hypothetical protein
VACVVTGVAFFKNVPNSTIFPITMLSSIANNSVNLTSGHSLNNKSNYRTALVLIATPSVPIDGSVASINQCTGVCI